MTGNEVFRLQLKDAGLRVTPQRLIVLQVLQQSKHPTAEQIAGKVRETHSSIATGTIYKILDTFVKHEIIHKVKTHTDVMRYDAILEEHHHLQNETGDRIEDYFDEELSEVIKDHLKKKAIPDFEISEIKLQITGKFHDHKTN